MRGKKRGGGCSPKKNSFKIFSYVRRIDRYMRKVFGNFTKGVTEFKKVLIKLSKNKCHPRNVICTSM